MVSGANPQAGLSLLVQLTNRECGHAGNDSIASIGSKDPMGLFFSFFLQRRRHRLCVPGGFTGAPSFYPSAPALSEVEG